MANPFYVAPPDVGNALQDLMGGYKQTNDLRKERDASAARNEAAQEIMQGGNPQNALARLIGIGDHKGAEAIAGVMQQKATQAFQQQQLGHQTNQLAETSRHNRASEGVANAGLNKPMILPPGSGLVNRDGTVLREPSADGLLDADTLGAMADQYRAGDTSVLTNLGRGAQGAQNIVALRKIIAQKNTAVGEGGAEQANRNAEYFGVKAGQRTLGTKQANIELAATEFQQVLPVVMEASKAVNRTNYPDLNRIIQMAQEKTGDPNIVKFGGGVNTIINLYARAISPSGVPTVSDKDHAREILNKAWSQGQFEAAVGMMNQEIDAALKSPEKVREDMRKRFLSGQGGAPHAPAPQSQQQAPAAPAKTQTGVQWKIL